MRLHLLASTESAMLVVQEETKGGSMNKGDKVHIATRNGFLVEAIVNDCSGEDGKIVVVTAEVYNVDGQPTNVFVVEPLPNVFRILRAV